MTVEKRHRRGGFAFALAVTVALAAGLLQGASHQAAGNLPAGTAISVSIDDPASGTLFLVPPAGTVDVPIAGTGAVGPGVVIKDHTVVYSLDRSGSMTLNAGIDCSGDGIADTRDVCAQAGIIGANVAAADPLSAVGLTGIASFSSTAAAHVVDLAPGGTAPLVAPGYDGNTNGTPDLADVTATLGGIFGTQTNYHDGLAAAFSIVSNPANTSAVNTVVFVTDADASSAMVGAHVTTLAGSVPANTTIHAFGIGIGPSCTFDGGTGTLNQVAALSTAGTGTCQVVADISQLADAIEQAIGSQLTSLEMSVDGGAPATIPNGNLSLPLPQPGPVSVDYTATAMDLGPGSHTICVTANGTDAGGAGSVKACIDVLVRIAGTIDIKPNSDPNSINTTNQGNIPVAIFGLADFDVTTIDVNSLRFGATGTEDSLIKCGPAKDINGDGYMDLVCHFDTQLTGFTVGDTVGILTGISGGGPFQATDAVRIVH